MEKPEKPATKRLRKFIKGLGNEVEALDFIHRVIHQKDIYTYLKTMLGIIMDVEKKKMGKTNFSVEDIFPFYRKIKEKGIPILFSKFPRGIVKLIREREKKDMFMFFDTKCLFRYFMYDIIFKIAKIYTNNWSEGGGKIISIE